jgi:exodeoxyribonuclease VII large subunit
VSAARRAAVTGGNATARILTVSEVAGRIEQALDGQLGRVWVAGELSGVKRAASGHLYVTLKDDRCQLPAVMFARENRLLVFAPRDGMDVVVRGRVGFYGPGGRLQLYVDAMEPRGLGALRLAFEQLRERLAAEGLFAAERKRALPAVPATIGVVTARGGAAIHDILVTLRRRWPAARVLLRPVRVQGEGAADDIAQGIADLQQVPGVDVLIVGRGGGSLEDLWAFNEERVARAIAASRIPVVSAVGHEVDVTIADYVADARAATPTAAATLVVPDRRELAERLAVAAAGLRAALRRATRRVRERVDALARGLGQPRRRVERLRLRLDELDARLRDGLRRRAVWERRELRTLAARLLRAGPGARAVALAQRLSLAEERLGFAIALRRRTAGAQLDALGARLQALSPLGCLERGYAIVRHGGADGAIVRDAAALASGDRVTMIFAQGAAAARVEGTTTR